ncbi:MAG: hypothetical protein GY801_33655 [bacterium]|nr:hypothetical protein [bacterium]
MELLGGVTAGMTPRSGPIRSSKSSCLKKTILYPTRPVLSLALDNEMTIQDMAQFDLSFTPPYAPFGIPSSFQRMPP